MEGNLLKNEFSDSDPKVALLNEARVNASKAVAEIDAEQKRDSKILSDASFRADAISRLQIYRQDLRHRYRIADRESLDFNRAPVRELLMKIEKMIETLKEIGRAAEQGVFEAQIVELRKELTSLTEGIAESQKKMNEEIVAAKNKETVNEERYGNLDKEVKDLRVRLAEATTPKEKAIEKPSAAPQWSAKSRSVSNAGDYIEQKFAEHPQGTAQGDLMRRLMAMRGYKTDMFKKAEDTAPATIPMTRPAQPTAEPKETAPKESDKKKKAA